MAIFYFPMAPFHQGVLRITPFAPTKQIVEKAILYRQLNRAEFLAVWLEIEFFGPDDAPDCDFPTAADDRAAECGVGHEAPHRHHVAVAPGVAIEKNIVCHYPRIERDIQVR